MIELGKYKLKYINEAPKAAAAADFEKTMVLRPGTMPKPPVAPAAAPAVQSMASMATAALPAAAPPPAASLARQGAIQLLSGANAGKELLLTKALTTLGKPGVQVAVITRRPQGYFITHVEGANFPVVNGKTLDAQAHPLNDHDVIEIAGTKMEFFYK